MILHLHILLLTFNIVQNFSPNQSVRIDANEKKIWQGEEALNIEINVRNIFIILLSEGMMANIDDSRGAEENNKSARHSGPALHTAGLPHGQHGAVARLQEEHQPYNQYQDLSTSLVGLTCSYLREKL